MNRLGLFAKWPRPGFVKTRLAATLGVSFATQLADAFLQDALTRLDGIAEQQVVLFTPDEDRDLFFGLTRNRWCLQAQGAGSLGERLQRFFEQSFALKSSAVVAVGTDSPTLPVEFARQAFKLLQSHEVVLGPAADGGYYLIGLSRHSPEIFDEIAWGTAEVLRQTVARLTGIRLALLPIWYDVDTIDDWSMLQGHLMACRLAGWPIDCPRTAQLAGVSVR